MAGSSPRCWANAVPTACNGCFWRPTHDQEVVRDELWTYVQEHLKEAAGILVVDETGFIRRALSASSCKPPP